MQVNNKLQFPSLETERLILKILTLNDTKEVFEHFSDIEVTKFMDIEPCREIKEAEEIITYHLEDSGCRWGLFDKNSGTFIGTAGFHYLRRTDQSFTAEIGFDLSKKFWKKGYMYEAMKEVISFGFNGLGLDMIDATVDPNNENSIKLIRKLGFEQDFELSSDKELYFFINKNLFNEAR